MVLQVVICANHAEGSGPPSYTPPPPPSDAKMEAAVATAKAAGLPAIKIKGTSNLNCAPSVYHCCAGAAIAHHV